jgi:hypothetical protein
LISIVADSAQVRVLILEKNHMAYFPEKIKA